MTSAESQRYNNLVMRVYDPGSRLTRETKNIDGENFVVGYAYDAAAGGFENNLTSIFAKIHRGEPSSFS